MGRYEDAAAMFETSLPIKRRVLGVQHRYTKAAISGLAQAYTALGRADDAIPLNQEWLELSIAAADETDAGAATLEGVAWALLTVDPDSLRDPDRALRYAERAWTLAESSGAEDLWKYLDTLALARHLTGDTAAAIETERRAIALMPEGADRGLHDRLAEYEAALAAGDDGQ